MKNFSRGYFKYVIGFLVLSIFAFSFIYLMKTELFKSASAEATEDLAISYRMNSEIKAAIAVQERYTHNLIRVPSVVGTAVGITETGKPSILVFLKEKIKPGVIPDSLDGIQVVTEITGEIFAMKPLSSAKVDPKSWFPRPVPIGVSTGNTGECSAGTIGARVKDSAGNVYALSNNHVYALENSAAFGSQILQPGLYDTNCTYNPQNVIGTLFDFEPIVFSTNANNVIDAAIALSSTNLLSNSTPANGYGIPKSTIVSPKLNQRVQKYGRTTGFTKGKITAINATINVSYSSGTARFVNQIVVQSSRPFIKPGDSGSLLVTDPDCYPVGLLFAGDSSGRYAIANPIGAVLTRFGVTIDGR
ncbi:MAG: S1 family peptidase [Proteobacteria bacterium]|nr:S1 family peptidase [Pseudomonadota bacterium]